MLSKTEKERRRREKDLETHGRAWFRKNTTEYEMCQFFLSSTLKEKNIISIKGVFWEQVTSLCLEQQKGH